MNKKRDWELLKPVWIGLVLGIGSILIMLNQDQSGRLGEEIMGVYGMIGLPLGWSFINQHKPQTIGLIGTWWFWFFWNFAKLVLAAMIGTVLIPYQLWKFYKSSK